MALKKILFIECATLYETGVEPMLSPGVVPSLLTLCEAGYRLIALGEPAAYPIRLLASQGIAFDETLELPRIPADGTGEMDRERSHVIASSQECLRLAEKLGFKPLPFEGWASLATRLTTEPRRARVRRVTKETEIEVEVALEGPGEIKVTTGIGYFDHMLEQLAKHGGFSLSVLVKGDLHIDEHHTVEDTALAVGEAMRRALGDKVGIGRYGFCLPMDEAEARVSVDLSGRPFLVFEAKLSREYVGELPTELVPHFFRSFSDALGATLQIRLVGENTHHLVEAAFKGLGRALRPALALTGGGLPSTKGSL